ncbi:MAG: MerR family transcriptional regulator [Thermodesulfobacteriota bacterium]|nr:MerR family transcriptional regulator [Thermodesulfobacteriota bacterium]
MGRIPDDKRYFRMGEASRIVEVEPYVLRYWEEEFPQVRPQRADSNQRTYQKKDLEVLLKIKKLLYEEKMTIKGAKQRLKKDGESKDAHTNRLILESIKEDLRDVLKILS